MIEFRRKWGRPWLVVLAVLAVACMAGVAGCGGDDDDDGNGGGSGIYDFNGTWTMNSKVVQSNLPDFPVGLAGIDVARITQVGTKITVVIEDISPLTGTCDPVAGTLTVAGKDGPLALQMNGVKIDADSFGGGLVIAGGLFVVSMNYTADLVTRARVASNPAAGDGIAKVLRLLK